MLDHPSGDSGHCGRDETRMGRWDT
ncbi:hypothetical protein LINPERHAP2_LOCUS3865 [Linum perenne]